ncbi:MAG TPA: XdhC family protein [Rectinemataceae bacterium]|nr:XdhC family protein [Rectinemataceae bacterium]
MSFDIVKAAAGRRGSVLVTVAAASGSVPRHAGSKMAVLPDGSIVGTVGGGVLEARALERAAACMAERRSACLSVELTGEAALGAVPVCGGVAELWLEYVDERSLLGEAAAALEAGRAAVLVSPRLGGAPRCTAVFDAAGALLAGAAGLPDGSAGALPARAAEAAASGVAALSETADWLYDPVPPPERLLVLGGGHVGRAVARFAVDLGFRVTIADDRPRFAAANRFPEGVETLEGRFAELVAGFPFGPSTYALVVTPGHLSDLDCARAILGREYKYAGLIGSRRKVRMIFEQLVAEGFDRDRVEALYSPVGVDIGAETPEEIAVSILAEMIAVRHGSPALAAMEADRRRRRA